MRACACASACVNQGVYSTSGTEEKQKVYFYTSAYSLVGLCAPILHDSGMPGRVFAW